MTSPRIETTTARTASEIGLAPRCPVCRGPMLVRAQRHGDEVDGLYWGCRRPLVCSGTRKIRDPLVIQPTADASTMAIFEWERSRDRRGWVSPDQPAPRASGFLGRLGRALTRPGAGRSAGRPSHRGTRETAQPVVTARADASELGALIDHGFVVLHDRHIAMPRAAVDHLVIGPTGVFVVDRKPWPGQISVSGENVYVDGRMRTAVTDDVLRATAAVQDILGHELKPLGASTRPMVLFDSAANPGFEASLGKVTLAARRSAAKVVRAGQPTLGPETVVRLALAADRLLD
jgi:hypothetical protein